MLKCRNVEKSYKGLHGDHMALKDVSLDVHTGEFVAIMGASGCGKTTLLNVLSGLEHDYLGNVFLGDLNLTLCTPKEQARIRRQEIGFIFQEFHLFDGLTAFENVAVSMALNDHTDRQVSVNVNQVLDALNIKHLRDRYPNELSRGQQQRVAIARALINKPKIIFADEPTGNLDSATTVEVMELLKQINQTYQVTILMVTHDESCARACDRIIRLEDGTIL